jgi:hypothetical protein
MAFANCKSIIRTQNVRGVDHHVATNCFFECKRIRVARNIAYTSHYREKDKHKMTATFLEDKTIWKFKDVLMKNVNRTLEDLQIYLDY